MSMQSASTSVSLKGVNMSEFDFSYYIDARTLFPSPRHFHHEITEFEFLVKAHPCDQFCPCYEKLQPEFIGAIALLKGQSSSTCLGRPHSSSSQQDL